METSQLTYHVYKYVRQAAAAGAKLAAAQAAAWQRRAAQSAAVAPPPLLLEGGREALSPVRETGGRAVTGAGPQPAAKARRRVTFADADGNNAEEGQMAGADLITYKTAWL